jgi:hypothetical protein
MKTIKRNYLTTAEVADILGYTQRAARRWLIRHDAGVKVGGRWFTTPSRLAAAFPDAFQRFARS